MEGIRKGSAGRDKKEGKGIREELKKGEGRESGKRKRGMGNRRCETR